MLALGIVFCTSSIRTRVWEEENWTCLGCICYCQTCGSYSGFVHTVSEKTCKIFRIQPLILIGSLLFLLRLGSTLSSGMSQKKNKERMGDSELVVRNWGMGSQRWWDQKYFVFRSSECCSNCSRSRQKMPQQASVMQTNAGPWLFPCVCTLTTEFKVVEPVTPSFRSCQVWVDQSLKLTWSIESHVRRD